MVVSLDCQTVNDKFAEMNLLWLDHDSIDIVKVSGCTNLSFLLA